MLRGVEQKRPGSGDGPVRQHGGLGAVVPVPLVARKRVRGGGGGTVSLLTAVAVLAAFLGGAGLALMQLRASEAAAAAECTALALDRDGGRTLAGPCTATTPWLPGTLTALLSGGSGEPSPGP
jgi:hypothetical protein